MFLYRIELKTNIGRMTCEIAASSEAAALERVRERLRAEAPSVRVKGMRAIK